MDGMPSWDEWQGLSKDAREYRQYTILVELCSYNERIKKLENRKWFDRTTAAVVGAVTGVLTALGVRIG
jgi:hypothetical protein